jgi:cytochrome c-type biogenesis protein CcmE
VDPARRRAIRLVVALAAAVSLAAALVYASFATANEARTPSQLLAGARPGRTYQLTGVLEVGSVHRQRGILSFGVRDRAGGRSVEVRYTGLIPDAFPPTAR